MSREQIEEMARIICGSYNNNICVFNHEPCDWNCSAKGNAKQLYEKGYRKATEVAREIFEEIDKKVKASLTIYLEEINKEHTKDTPLYDRCSGIVFALRNTEDFLAELKKKYTEEKE